MRALATLLLLTTVLAGCSGDGSGSDATPTPTGTATASPTATATSSATPTPSNGADQACKPNEVPDPRGPYTYEPGDVHEVRVRFETTQGVFVVQTDAEHAPVTAANFLRYVDDGFYACTTFHRIAPGFVVQGGGYLSDHRTLKPTRDPIPLEATAQEPNVQWSLSMARTSSPNSATSQFFVNLEDNPNLDPSGPGTGYAVFAHLVEGQPTIEAMLAVPEGRPFGAGGHYPAEPIVILNARRE